MAYHRRLERYWTWLYPLEAAKLDRVFLNSKMSLIYREKRGRPESDAPFLK
jgi:hypothetical protein